jgi:hypothetical protein
MKYRITQQPDGVDIAVQDVAGQEKALLQAFEECRQGRCSCPTSEYGKLAGMAVDQTADGIHLQLKAKAGEALDAAEIGRCLDHTAAKTGDAK